jgi:geranylgeranylglycerol-phosphate geranylgeranyltransferase
MNIFDIFKDHVLIGGAGSVAGSGLLVLLVASGGMSAGHLTVGSVLFVSVIVAAALTGLGVYALNAYYDREVDRINKPSRPIPAGRITPDHAFKYAISLMALGWLISLAVSVFTGRYFTFVLWSVFTLLGFAYSTPPLKLKARHIYGNLCFAAFAALTFTISNVAFGIPIGEPVSYIGGIAFLTIFVVGLINMKDFHDYDGDKAKGDVTMAVKLGKMKAAAISLVLMAVYVGLLMPIYPSNYYNPTAFFFAYWFQLIVLVSFGVYMMLEHFAGPTVSNTFSGTQYYLIILLVAYAFMRGPLVGSVPSSDLYIGSGYWWELVAVFSLYTLTAIASVYLAWKKGQILKPK